MQNRLEELLAVFKQENFINKDHHLKNFSYETNDELVKMILKQLEKAAADKELLDL